MNIASVSHLKTKEQRAIEVFVDRLNGEFPGEILQVPLFGSKARGDSGPWSDMDILIIVEEESWPLREDISTLAGGMGGRRPPLRVGVNDGRGAWHAPTGMARARYAAGNGRTPSAPAGGCGW